MHTPALELETLLKTAEKPHSDDHSRSFSLVAVDVLKKEYSKFFHSKPTKGFSPLKVVG